MATNQKIMELIKAQQYEKMRQNLLKRNMQYALPDWQQKLTQLQPTQEQQFLQWIQQNKVPFNPADKFPDYDMRGFWLAQQNKDPRAANATDPYDKQIHYPDYWKTPYHETFSNESQWAKEGAPSWKDDVLTTPQGEVIFDPKKAN